MSEADHPSSERVPWGLHDYARRYCTGSAESGLTVAEWVAEDPPKPCRSCGSPRYAHLKPTGDDVESRLLPEDRDAWRRWMELKPEDQDAGGQALWDVAFEIGERAALEHPVTDKVEPSAGKHDNVPGVFLRAAAHRAATAQFDAAQFDKDRENYRRDAAAARLRDDERLKRLVVDGLGSTFAALGGLISEASRMHGLGAEASDKFPAMVDELARYADEVRWFVEPMLTDSVVLEMEHRARRGDLR